MRVSWETFECGRRVSTFATCTKHAAVALYAENKDRVGAHGGPREAASSAILSFVTPPQIGRPPQASKAPALTRGYPIAIAQDRIDMMADYCDDKKT
jgi:hypothetical protein